jgi:hypothetical protein
MVGFNTEVDLNQIGLREWSGFFWLKMGSIVGTVNMTVGLWVP